MDFADATLVVLSEQYPRAKLITIDERDYKDRLIITIT